METGDRQICPRGAGERALGQMETGDKMETGDDGDRGQTDLSTRRWGTRLGTDLSVPWSQ